MTAINLQGSVDFEQLQAGSHGAHELFIRSLETRGFVRVRLSEGRLLNRLKAGVSAGRQMATFRFPPVDGQATYSTAFRDCFKALFELSRLCLNWVLAYADESSPDVKLLRDKLHAAACLESELFAPNELGHRPFDDSNIPFSSSFFNVFDYDHGLLNVHKDRYLITAIFADSDPETAAERSVLWVRGADQDWTNVDRELGANDVVFMLGEELECLFSSQPVSLYAAEHCIRVDPNGEFLARAHFRADPASVQTGNRLSTAFILGEPELVMG